MLNINIRILNEEIDRGTAGCLLRFQKEILEGSPDQIFVMNGDISCSFPLEQMLDLHKMHGGTCTILAKKVPKENSKQYGCIVVDTTTSEVLHYSEKPESFVSEIINTGVYLVNPSFFDDLEKCSQQSEEPLEIFRLEKHVFPILAGEKKCFVTITDGFWLQVKSASSLLNCSTNLLSVAPKETLSKGSNVIGNVFIHPSCKIDSTASIGPNVTIDEGCVIGAGVRLRNSIISKNSIIKEHACVLNSILASGCIIGRWTRLEGSPNEKDLINGGLSILGSGVVLGSECIVRSCVILPNKEISSNSFNQIIL